MDDEANESGKRSELQDSMSTWPYCGKFH